MEMGMANRASWEVFVQALRQLKVFEPIGRVLVNVVLLEFRQVRKNTTSSNQAIFITADNAHKEMGSISIQGVGSRSWFLSFHWDKRTWARHQRCISILAFINTEPLPKDLREAERCCITMQGAKTPVPYERRQKSNQRPHEWHGRANCE